MLTADPTERQPHHLEDLEEELAAALPETQGSRFIPLISRWALHVVPFILLSAAAWVLWREFHEINAAQVAAAMRAWGQDAMLAALGLSALSFLLMGLVEWLGLRWAGARLPWTATLAGSFIANAIAHSLGANLLVSGAVRARYYGQYGVTLRQVAATTLFQGFSFGVGLSSLAGASLLLAGAEEIADTRIAHPVADIAGLVLVAGVAGYIGLCALRRRPIRGFGHTLKLPSGRVAIAQAILGAADNAVAAMIIWSLLPDGTVSYFSFVGAYAPSVAAGLASSVPGGVGVFEGSLSTLLANAQPAALAAAFLGYRLAYFLIPLTLAAAALALDTLRRRTA
ncbi:lysylphosphatidylglycerol synthase domain-containing protein [Phenylobacterium sp.]|uniref:lysylphosphatidylglycerol synthase domain-containing protein n=1 Tax=Phenylobacterium sp. TaxID=1871053 RepID=UPI003983D466